MNGSDKQDFSTKHERRVRVKREGTPGTGGQWAGFAINDPPQGQVCALFLVPVLPTAAALHPVSGIGPSRLLKQQNACLLCVCFESLGSPWGWGEPPLTIHVAHAGGPGGFSVWSGRDAPGDRHVPFESACF